MTLIKVIKRIPKRHLFLLVSVVVFLILSAVFLIWQGKHSARAAQAVFEVREMSLNILISEEGVLQAKESVKIIPEIDSEAKIIWIEEEGKYVQEGDKLVQLDHSGLASLLEKVELELFSSAAELKIAEEEVKKYTLGEYPQKLKELDFAIRKAEVQLEKAKDEQPKESASDIYSKSELRDAEIAVEEAKMNLEKVRLDKFIYEEYTHPKNLLEKETKAEEAKQKNDSKVFQRDSYKSQLEKMVLEAPCPGLVIYATTGDSRRRGNEEPVKVGSVVYKGQTIIILPNVSRMQVNVAVHEVDIHKVKEKQEVDIRIGAFPDMALTGRVMNIGSLARDRDWRTQGVKVFDVIVEIDGMHEKLRPGMTAKVDIKVEKTAKLPVIPIEAVFDDPENNEKYCFVRENGLPKRRVVRLGSSDNSFVVVEDGLRQGEVVYQLYASEDFSL